MTISNGIPLINGVAHSWGCIVATIGGVPITGIVAIEYGESQDVENHYGAGRYPISRSKGRITPTAKITLYMDEVEAIQAQCPNGRLQDIDPFDIEVTYLPESLQITTDKIRNCSFKDNKRAWKEGDTKQEVELELLPSHIVWGSKK